MLTTGFHFKPEPCPSSARAFSWFFQLLASLLVLTISIWMLNLWQKGLIPTANHAGTAPQLIANKSSSFFGFSTQQGWLLAAWALLVYTWIWILASRFSFNATHLQQSWVWKKELAYADLAYVKILRIRGLEWLIAPRLYARSFNGKFQWFYAGQAHIWQQWERLERELRTFHRF